MRALPLAACLLLALPCWAKPGDVGNLPHPSAEPASAAEHATGPSIAASATRAGRAFASARAADLQTLVLGPAAPTLTPVAPASCETLYRQRVALMHQQTDSRPAWTEDPRNQVATAFGFVSSISFAYLPFTAIQNYLADSRKAGLEARIDQLRQASASQMCYQR